MASRNFWKLNICAWLSALLLASPLWAASPDLYAFTSPEQSQRFGALTKELRCLVCQNQSIADSDASLAKDLRHKVYLLMVNEKKSDEEIKQFLVSRYGQFILFSPPFKGGSALLWAFPGLLLLLIFGMLFFKKRGIRTSLA